MKFYKIIVCLSIIFQSCALLSMQQALVPYMKLQRVMSFPLDLLLKSGNTQLSDVFTLTQEEEELLDHKTLLPSNVLVARRL